MTNNLEKKLLEFREAIFYDMDVAPYDGSPEEWFRKVENVIETKLVENEKKVLIEKYGLFNVEPKKAKEIAAELNLSTSRIYQIEKKALRKLRRVAK